MACIASWDAVGAELLRQAPASRWCFVHAAPPRGWSTSQAADELARIKGDIAAGRKPFHGPVVAPGTIRSLMTEWADGLTNRNADHSRDRPTRCVGS